MEGRSIDQMASALNAMILGESLELTSLAVASDSTVIELDLTSEMGEAL